MKKKTLFVVLVVSVSASIFLLSCKKNSYLPEFSKALVNINVRVGSAELIEWNSIQFFNAAGNNYGVSKINFYISGIILKNTNGVLYHSNKVFYIDPSISSKSYFSLDSIPPGNYNEILFLLGLDTAANKTLGLPANTDNINMAWPDMMGGGYHFLKFEGHYLDTANSQKGFAVHLGKNENLPHIAIAANMNQKYWDHEYSLVFDLNEIFETPNTYNLNIEKNYTMTDSLSMSKISNNITDAFSLFQNK